MQLLFDESEEMGVHKGLGIFKGKVRRFAEGEKVPHIGWNEVNCKPSALWNGLPDHYFYFVHSYHVEPREDIVIGLTNYGYDFVSAVQKDNVFGVQFHPEKSQKSGQVILRNFLRFC
jgi:glutamine amidotransferase